MSDIAGRDSHARGAAGRARLTAAVIATATALAGCQPLGDGGAPPETATLGGDRTTAAAVLQRLREDPPPEADLAFHGQIAEVHCEPSGQLYRAQEVRYCEVGFDNGDLMPICAVTVSEHVLMSYDDVRMYCGVPFE